MKYLCTNCGHIIAKLACSNCGYEIDIVEYEKIRDYARRATYYGYQYRIEYERQVSDNGAVNSRYSLYQPDKWYEWLAMAALSGFVGTYATDLVKYVGTQLLSLLQPKIDNNTLNSEEQKLTTFLLDNGQLNKFTIYINNYYNGMPNIDKKVEAAIIEEELADLLTEEMNDKFFSILKKSDPNDRSVRIETFIKINRATKQKRVEKPSIEETRSLLKSLKKDLKKMI